MPTGRHTTTGRDPRNWLRVLAVGLLVSAFGCADTECDAPPARGDLPPLIEMTPYAEWLSIKKPGASPGYTLISPIASETTYLVDDNGRVVKQ
ncbi:MAG: hypothetical protein FJ304_20520 [Planctomycetes bacterium]|nr:hypothetical protein [Planctomycetota bacterium]